MDTASQYRVNDGGAVGEWREFWRHATTLAETKEEKLKPAREKEAWRAMQRWMRLYYRRWNCIGFFNEFRNAPVPDGAWERVGHWGLSDDGDHCWGSDCFGLHGDPLTRGWVLEMSIPTIQTEGQEPTMTPSMDKWPIIEYEFLFEEQPVLQIVKIVPEKNLPEKVKSRLDSRLVIILSDGDLCVMAILHPRILSKKLRKNNLVKVNEFCIDHNPVPIVHILSMEIWNDVIPWRMRNPKIVARYDVRRDLKKI